MIAHLALLFCLTASPAAEAPSPLGAGEGDAATSLTLEDAVHLALRSGANRQLAQLDTEDAQALAWASWAGVLPRLDVDAAFGRSFFGARKSVTTIPQLSTDPVTGAPTFTFAQQAVRTPYSSFEAYSLGAQLQLVLFDGFKNWSQIRKGTLGVRASERQLDEAGLQTVDDVTRLFDDALKAEKSLAVLAETAVRSEEFARRTEALYEAGRVPKSEMLAAQVNLGTDRINFELQKGRVVQTQAALSVALGAPAEKRWSLVAEPAIDRVSERTLDPLPPLEGLLAEARASRPALKRVKALQDAAKVDVTIARADLWPQLGLAFSYDRTGPHLAGADGVWADPSRQYVASAQLAVQWNLFNGRQTSAAVQRAEIARRRLDVEAAELDREIGAQVIQAQSTLLALGRAVGLAQGNLTTATEGERLARQRLDAGSATQLEVRDATLKLTQAQLTLVNARIDFLTARADLARAIGGELP